MQQHDVDDTKTKKYDQDKAWPPDTPDAREAEDDIHQQTQIPENNTQGFREQIHSSNEAAQRCPQRHALEPQNTNSLRDTGDNTTNMIFEGEPAVKLHAKNVKVGNSSNGNRRQDLVTLGMDNSPGSGNH